MDTRVLLGLGNPGPAYRVTRHNAGAAVARAVARRWRLPVRRAQGPVRVGQGLVGGVEVIVGIPQTFMNRSGDAAAALLARWPVPPAQFLVVCDDVALPLGTLRLRPEGSDGGHRGLRSVTEALGTSAFPRLRVGIRPAPMPGDRDSLNIGAGLDAFVLAPFTAPERRQFSDVVEAAVEACTVWIRQGLDAAMNQFNRKVC